MHEATPAERARWSVVGQFELVPDTGGASVGASPRADLGARLADGHAAEVLHACLFARDPDWGVLPRLELAVQAAAALGDTDLDVALRGEITARAPR